MDDPRRRACDELAELLATPEGLRTARLLQLTEALEARAEPEPVRQDREPPAEKGPRPISIWQPRRRDGDLVFERPDPHPLGDHFARRRTLTAVRAPGTARICYFGESAAAGYLYAPHFTPAEALERQLCAAAGDGSWEVVDLARTNETLGSLVAALERSLQLDPDLLVIFAGNNWNLLETPEVSPYAPSVHARQHYALALRRGGLAGVAELARRDLATKAEAALARVAELAGRAEAPVIVVVPEVNLSHWHDRQPPPWLASPRRGASEAQSRRGASGTRSDGSRRWHEVYAEAGEHLAAGRGEAALDRAAVMLELDGGLCPTTHRVRAEALTVLGRGEEARRACEAEVESGHYATQCFLGVPRASRRVAEILRRESARHGFAVVDLPRLFSEHAGPRPGSDLFLDYCHLSAEGIELAMAAVAAAILEQCTGEPVHVAPRRPGVEPAVEAVACLGAAVHGAHRLLAVRGKRTYLERWCRRALEADPAVAAAMRDLLEARCVPGPAVLTAAQQRNLASGHRLLLQHGWRWQNLDADLIEALIEALEDAGHEIRGDVGALLLKHHGVSPEGVDLSRPPYLWEPLERFFPEAMAPRGYTGRATYRSPWPESGFCLIADEGVDVQLDVTLRLPSIEGAPEARRGDVTLYLDGQAFASVSAGESWSRHTVRLPPSRRPRPIHRLALAWPPLPAAGDAALESAIRRLENGVEADLHPVFGEVFALVARLDSATRAAGPDRRPHLPRSAGRRGGSPRRGPGRRTAGPSG